MPPLITSDPTKTRNVSVRFQEAAFQDVADVARVFNMSMGQVIRTAVEEYVANCKNSPSWSESIAQMQATLERLRVPPLPSSVEQEPVGA